MKLENHVETATTNQTARSSTAFEQDTRCPTCNLGWWLNPPVKSHGDNPHFLCIGCKAIYTPAMLAAPDMLAALRPFSQIALLKDDDHRPNLPDMIDGPDLAITPAQVRIARAAVAKATGGGA